MTPSQLGAKADQLYHLKEARFSVPFFVVVPLDSSSELDIQEWVHQEFPPEAYVAVRSSSVTEDTTNQARAGYFYSAIGIPLQHVEKEVTHVQTSIEGQGSAIIQQFIPSEKAGVLFSNAGQETMVINANWGLCSSVVEGYACDEYFLQKHDGTLLDSRISSQKHARYFHEGTFQTHLTDAQVLSPHERERLVHIAQAVETLFGTPQDIEWCIYQDHIYL
ncbi:MAG: hypothetical protein BRC24_01760, partial [Parcubacteria group bacterium SW_4_46_8]